MRENTMMTRQAAEIWLPVMRLMAVMATVGDPPRFDLLAVWLVLQYVVHQNLRLSLALSSLELVIRKRFSSSDEIIHVDSR
jgi:hypothetical protein